MSTKRPSAAKSKAKTAEVKKKAEEARQKEIMKEFKEQHWRAMPHQMKSMDEHIVRLADINDRLSIIGSKMRFAARDMQRLKQAGESQKYKGQQTIYHQLEKQRDALSEQQMEIVTHMDTLIKNIKKQQNIWGRKEARAKK
jgi:hypothetical protein